MVKVVEIDNKLTYLINKNNNSPEVRKKNSSNKLPFLVPFKNKFWPKNQKEKKRKVEVKILSVASSEERKVYYKGRRKKNENKKNLKIGNDYNKKNQN